MAAEVAKTAETLATLSLSDAKTKKPKPEARPHDTNTEILNPRTNRWVQKSSRVGKQVLLAMKQTQEAKDQPPATSQPAPASLMAATPQAPVKRKPTIISKEKLHEVGAALEEYELAECSEACVKLMAELRAKVSSFIEKEQVTLPVYNKFRKLIGAVKATLDADELDEVALDAAAKDLYEKMGWTTAAPQ